MAINQYNLPSINARFEQNFIPVTETGCWIWTGYTHRQGYGSIRVNKKTTLAHRLSWDLYNGPIPCGMHIMHKCDVTACVNPNHLMLGTHAENQADKANKGRRRTTDVPKYPNVYFRKSGSNWMVRIMENNKPVFQKMYDSLLDAVCASINARKSLSGHS